MIPYTSIHQQHPSTTFTREAIIGGPCDAPLSPEKLPTSIRTEILNCQDPATGFLWLILRKSMSTNRHLRKKLAAPEIPPEKKKNIPLVLSPLSIDRRGCLRHSSGKVRDDTWNQYHMFSSASHHHIRMVCLDLWFVKDGSHRNQISNSWPIDELGPCRPQSYRI